MHNKSYSLLLKSFFNFLLLVQCLCFKAGASVPYSVIYLKNYSGNDGLPGSQVNYLMQDSKGFIWIATDKGVSRFDGQHFKNFTSADGLESNEAFRIAEDNYHRIFFYCDNYKICYYQDGHIYKLSANEKVLLPPFGSFFFNRYNELCINYGLSSQTYHFPELKPKRHPENKNVVYGEQGAELMISPTEKVILQKRLTDGLLDPQEATYDKPYRLDVQDGRLLLISKNNLQLYDHKNGAGILLREFKFDGNVNTVNRLSDNAYAVNTFKQGSYIINCRTGNRRNFLNHYIVTHTLTDREGNIWFGTYDNGLFLSPDATTHVVNTAGGLANNNVQKLGVLGNYVFAGHVLSGISYIRKTAGEGFQTGTLSVNQWRSDYNRITSLLPVNNRFMVIGTDNGIWQLMASEKPPLDWAWRLYSVGPVKDIVQRTDSTCYLTHRTLRVIFDWHKKFGWYDIDSLRLTSLAWYKGHPLVGTLYGLYRLNITPTDNHFKMARLLKENDVNAVKCLAVNGAICAVGTEDKGVLLLNSGLPKQFNEPNICSGNIRKLVWTNANTLWVCTPNGVSIISFSNNYQNYRIVQLNTSNGLPSDNIADVVKKDQDYYIATDQGIAVLQNPGNNSRPKPLLIGDDLPGPQNEFKYGQPVLFNCIALSYKSLGKIQYRFRLKGIDKDWVTAASGEKRFDLLPPGSYELDAIAVDRFNQLSLPLVFQFTVIPLWYQRIWLQAMALVVALFIGFSLIRKYYQSIIGLQKKDYENALALQRERQRISSEVHDDLGASISGIKLQTEMLSKKVSQQPVFKEIEAIHSAIAEISTQVRLIIWSLDTENDELGSLVNFVHKQAVKMFECSDIQLHESIYDKVTGVTVNGEKRRQVYLLIKEVLNNIIKHSCAANAFLDIRVNKNKLYISIRDDGRGFLPDIHNHETMGIRNIYDRAKKLNADLKINTGEGKGTTISFTMNL
jgi:signal transduction histidine kinase/ligand-binding sensor domain-containing protein